MSHVLEALMVGMALKRTSTRRRICFVDKDSVQLRALLNTVWEIREFSHLDVSDMKTSGASHRLSKVYSKIQAWNWLAGEAEVAIMLDTDLYIKQTLDNAFYKVSHCQIAAAFRGSGDFKRLSENVEVCNFMMHLTKVEVNKTTSRSISDLKKKLHHWMLDTIFRFIKSV